MKCSEFIEGITELAFGRNDSSASDHVAICSDCAAMLKELRIIAHGFGLGKFDPPDSLISRAATISLPHSQRALSLVRSSLSFAGARRNAADTFQNVFEGAGFQVRTMYTRTGKKWLVMADVTPPVEAIRASGKLIEPKDGKFEFEAGSIDGTGFTLTVAGQEFDVPPGSTNLSDDGR